MVQGLRDFYLLAGKIKHHSESIKKPLLTQDNRRILRQRIAEIEGTLVLFAASVKRNHSTFCRKALVVCSSKLNERFFLHQSLSVP